MTSVNIVSNEDRLKQLKETQESMEIKKKNDIVNYIEKRINENINKSSETSITIKYSQITNAVGYKFSNNDLYKMIQEYYTNRGFYVDVYYEYTGFISDDKGIKINIKNKSNNCDIL